MQTKDQKRKRRQTRIRMKVVGTAQRPRLAVFRSNKHIKAQLIDDSKGHTIASSSDTTLKGVSKKHGKEIAALVGGDIAEKAKKNKITSVVFDRGGFSYTGNISALAEGARKGGLKF